MEIVSTSTPVKKKNGLDDLLLRKAELKKQIEFQHHRISDSVENLLSPASLSAYIFTALNKSVGIIGGVRFGYNVFKIVRGLFKRKRA